MKDRRIEIEAEEELQELIEQQKFTNKKIYAMGSVINIERIEEILELNGLCVELILDNNPAKQGTIQIINKECIVKLPAALSESEKENSCMIILSIRFWLEMKEQMEALGYVEGKDLFVLEALTFDKKKKYVEYGFEIYRELTEKYGNDMFLFVFHGPIGDNYLFARYYREYIEAHNISNPVCIGTKATGKISGLFQLDKFHQVDREAIVALEFLYMFAGDEINNIKILQIWEFQFHFNRERIRFDERFVFSDTYKYYVYGLSDDAKAEKPFFESNIEKYNNEFEKKKLEPGKTVILSPFAYSINIQPPKGFWEKLINELRKNGLSVCINVNNEKEESYFDAPAICFEIKESGSVLEFAGTFIGMRSGFCDVTSSAKCRKIILYPKRYEKEIDYDRHRSDMDFGGLRNMGLCEDAIEIEFEYRDISDGYWYGLAKRISQECL